MQVYPDFTFQLHMWKNKTKLIINKENVTPVLFKRRAEMKTYVSKTLCHFIDTTKQNNIINRFTIKMNSAAITTFAKILI
jgi:hypothetical protein